MKQFLQQLNIQDSNAQLWLVNLHGMILLSAHDRSVYHIDAHFGLNLQIFISASVSMMIILNF